MRNLALIAVFFLTAVFNVCAAEKGSSEELREYALNGFPFWLVDEYRHIDVSTIDAGVLILLIENQYEWRFNDGTPGIYDFNVILDGETQLQVMQRPGAEVKEIFLALIKNHGFLSKATERLLMGLPLGSSCYVHRNWVDGAWDFVDSDKVLPYAWDIFKAHERRSRTPLVKDRYIVTRNSRGQVTKRVKWDPTMTLRSVFSPKQVALFEKLTGSPIGRQTFEKWTCEYYGEEICY